MRISGLASGFDTDEMVKQLMQVERMKVDKVEQNKQIMLWRQESYNNINKSFANFILNTQKNLGLKKASSTGALFGSSYKNVDYVTKATSSDESVASIRSANKAMNGSYTLEVGKLATSAKIDGRVEKGQDNFGTELKLSLSTGEKDKDGNLITSIIEVKPSNGKNVTMKDIADTINSTTVTKGDKEVPLGINALYVEDSTHGVLSLQTTATGESAKIEISALGENGKNFMTAMGYEKLEDVEGYFKGEFEEGTDNYDSFQGKNAEIKFNGMDLTYESNNIDLNGLNIEIKAKSTGPINLNVSTNTEGIIEKIQEFVDEYNKLIDEVSGLINEKTHKGYQPLSQEERKAMSEEDLKLWDEKAKSGLLNRDENLNRILQTMRTDLYKTLDGAGTFNHITQIGISTESYAKGTTGGRLQIDMDKLKGAIEKDADGVMDLLFKEGSVGKDGKENFESSGRVEGLSTKGVFTRIYDDLIDGMKGIIDKSGHGGEADLYRGIKSNMLIDFVTKKSSISDIDKSINDMNREIDNLNILLARKEESHYAKFTAMEKAMYQMNSQSNWLAQQFFM